MALRKRHQDSFVKQNGVKLGFMSFFVKAVVHGLQAVPELNVRIEGSDLVENHYFGVGVAVGTEKKGLLSRSSAIAKSFPLPRSSRESSAMPKKRGRAQLLSRTCKGAASPSPMGIYGSMLSTPILNPPQSGILGMHAIEERAVVRNGEIVIRPMMYLALSYDHRVVDGKEAVTFLVKVKEAIEEPARLALGI